LTYLLSSLTKCLCAHVDLLVEQSDEVFVNSLVSVILRALLNA